MALICPIWIKVTFAQGDNHGSGVGPYLLPIIKDTQIGQGILTSEKRLELQRATSEASRFLGVFNVPIFYFYGVHHQATNNIVVKVPAPYSGTGIGASVRLGLNIEFSIGSKQNNPCISDSGNRDNNYSGGGSPPPPRRKKECDCMDCGCSCNDIATMFARQLAEQSRLFEGLKDHVDRRVKEEIAIHAKQLEAMTVDLQPIMDRVNEVENNLWNGIRK